MGTRAPLLEVAQRLNVIGSSPSVLAQPPSELQWRLMAPWTSWNESTDPLSRANVALVVDAKPVIEVQRALLSVLIRLIGQISLNQLAHTLPAA